LARQVKPARAFPFTGRRPWALAGGMALAAFGLFAVRYLVTDSLSLRQSLIPIHLGEVLERVAKSFSTDKRQAGDAVEADKQDQAESANSTKDAAADKLRGEEMAQGPPEDELAQAMRTETADARGGAASANDKTENHDGAQPGGQPQTGDRNDSQNGEQAASQQQSGTKEQPANGQPSQTGLMDRMKDALSSLMAKMRPNASGQKSQHENQRAAQEQNNGDQSASDKSQNGEAQKDARDQPGSQEASADAKAQGQTSEKAPASQGRNSDQSADKKSADAHSGIGRQDGDKDVKEAEQLKAMGKLAEIIGKRSASVTGDMMVENPSGKQQLKTEYSQRMGHHADLGGEINRDEIPLIYQSYVREYMEEVHKQAQNGNKAQ
jgi:hypothetical protein